VPNVDAELHRVVEKGVLPTPIAVRYLTLYLGNAEWEQHINALWTRFTRQNGASREQLVARMRRSIACAILLPVHDPSKLEERPENILHRASTWSQFQERDWFHALQGEMARDLEVQGWRAEALALGIIDPIEEGTYTRQAFDWLFEQAVLTGCVTPETQEYVTTRHANMVKAYGGAVIGNIFLRHQDVLGRVLNWRTGYFFERAIYNVYTPTQVLKIKRAELTKTNTRLVKRVKAST
jgi:hypothetical protein